MSSDFPCPHDLKVGDHIDVDFSAGYVEDAVITDVWPLGSGAMGIFGMPMGLPTHVYFDYATTGGGTHKYCLDLKAPHNELWRKTRTTLRSIPVPNGATCIRCKELYEHAEWRENFICHSCQIWEP
jgi:hypothetical protein